MRIQIIEMTGQRLGRLVVAGRAGKNRHKHTLWRCVCDCGKETITTGGKLRSGHTQSCGCLNREIVNAKQSARATHGLSRVGISHGIYYSWRSAMRRCTDPDNPDFHNYGGRGIKMCDRWLENPALFRTDMGDKPKGYTLERKDVNGDYEPGNCVWATKKTQARNMRVNHLVDLHDGAGHLPLSQQCERLNRNTANIHRRIALGWTDERAILTPTIKPYIPYAETEADKAKHKLARKRRKIRAARTR